MYLTRLLEPVKQIASDAGHTLWQFYQHRTFEQQQKADQSPVTSADLAANQLIIKQLNALTPDIPIISEEVAIPALRKRQLWSRYWLVDPMDGTQEFVAGSGDFAVSIALVEQDWPVFGLIYWPKEQCFYYAASGEGAFLLKNSQLQRLQVNRYQAGDTLRIAVSRRQPQHLITARLNSELPVEFIPLGSCSLKSCLVAEGKADCYLRIGPTGEWDTGAVQVIVEEAGGQIFSSDFEPLSYNQRETLDNPDFIVAGQAATGWPQLIKRHNTTR